jgi:hypothetical protein
MADKLWLVKIRAAVYHVQLPPLTDVILTKPHQLLVFELQQSVGGAIFQLSSTCRHEIRRARSNTSQRFAPYLRKPLYVALLSIDSYEA